jgi:hypothetical protein
MEGRRVRRRVRSVSMPQALEQAGHANERGVRLDAGGIVAQTKGSQRLTALAPGRRHKGSTLKIGERQLVKVSGTLEARPRHA